MENSLKYYLSLFAIGLLFGACQQSSPPLYEKTFSEKEKKELAKTLKDGIFNYYQGSPAMQALLEEALEYDPTYGTLYREVGVPYLKRGLASGFKKWYDQAIYYDALGWQDWRGYLYLYFYRDYENAIADFNATDSLTPDIVDYPQSLSVLYLRGVCYLMLEDYKTAINFFEQHIAYESTQSGFDYIDPKTFLFRGMAYLGIQQKEKALKDFQTGLQLSPDNADLLFQLSKWETSYGDKIAALDYLKRAKLQFAKGNYNKRPYVEEFYQLYEVDLMKLEETLQSG